jgi:uncharacterized membrane protein YeaQ/YmgE (transglycosylase-associated protein family)
MGWIVTLLMGGIVGWLASKIMKTDAQMGIIANIVVGAVGSVLGFWVAGMFDIAITSGLVRFVIALLGAVVLLWILRALGLFRPKVTRVR